MVLPTIAAYLSLALRRCEIKLLLAISDLGSNHSAINAIKLYSGSIGSKFPRCCY